MHIDYDAEFGPYAWSYSAAPSQGIQFHINGWTQTLDPTEKPESFRFWRNDFHGTVSSDPISQMKVGGSVQLFNRDHGMAIVRANWREAPDTLEGYCSIVEASRNEPMLAVVLLASAHTLARVDQLIATAASTKAGNVRISLQVDCPEDTENRIWKAWRGETLRIRSWTASVDIGDGAYEA